jgi:fucose 4-O-acetylase-like acetyltransferase
MASTAPSMPAPGRDRFLDVVRCLALAAVVFNHYLYSVYSWDPSGGTFRMIQEKAIGQAWVTWPFVWELPAFFFVGGAVIRSSALAMPYGRFVAKRVWRLALPAIACLATGMVVELIANGLDVDACRPGNGPLAGFLPMYLSCPAQIWVGPLWFMMVFVPLTLLSPLLARWYVGRTRWVMLATIVGLVALSDVNLFNAGHALPTSELGWIVPWLLGFSYADGSLTRLSRRTLVVWGVVAGLVMILAIGFGPWSSILGRFPRSLETVMEGVVSIPLMVAFRGAIGGWADWRPIGWLVDAIGPRMMSMYVWHQPAQAIVVAACAAFHLDMPDDVGWPWLLEKVPWFVACLAMLKVVLWLAEPIERIPPPRLLAGRPARKLADATAGGA